MFYCFFCFGFSTSCHTVNSFSCRRIDYVDCFIGISPFAFNIYHIFHSPYFVKYLPRVGSGVFFHVLKAVAVCFIASSVSAFPLVATLSIVSPVAGLITSIVLLAFCHSTLIYTIFSIPLM